MNRYPEDRDPVPAYQQQYAPPLGPPPPQQSYGAATGPSQQFAPPPGPPPPLYDQLVYAQPGSYQNSYLPPPYPPPDQSSNTFWHTFPFYCTSIDRADGGNLTTALYFRLPTDSQSDAHASLTSAAPQLMPRVDLGRVMSACRCSERDECRCGQRGPVAFTAELAHHSGVRDIPKNDILIMRCGDTSDVVARAKRGSLLHKNRWVLTDSNGRTLGTVERDGTTTSVAIVGIPLALRWVRDRGMFDLVVSERNHLVAQHDPHGIVTLSDRSARMAQNYACDVQQCPFRNTVHGFVFRCLTCTEELKGRDTVDFCESHLAEVCRGHDPTHRFARLPPRTGGPGQMDDNLRESALLRLPDLLLDRQRHEMIVSSLAIALLD